MNTSLAPTQGAGRRLRILLVGNYRRDRQESMQRFADLLHHGLAARGHECRLVRPEAAVARLAPGAWGIGKWLGYLDKYLLFPPRLARHAAWAEVVHICDHSNAMYTARRAGRPAVITCHDLLAVRGARGEDTDCPASRAGRRLQEWIVDGLQGAQAIASVSTFTQGDAETIVGHARPIRYRVILNGLNHGYRQLAPGEADARLAQAWPGAGTRPYVLHVGSGLRRKNRDGVLRVFAALVARGWAGDLVFAGQAMDADLIALGRGLGCADRIHQVVQPDNNRLEALYNRAHAFLFPSRHEGFGWPIIEAQACGCPVVASTCGPFAEVAGGAALLRRLDDEAGMADDLLALDDPVRRATVVAAGLRNVARFAPGIMLDQYESLYREVAG